MVAEEVQAVQPRRKGSLNPFRPPGYVKQYEALARTGGGGASKGYAKALRFLAILFSFTVVGLILAIPMFIVAEIMERGVAKAESALTGFQVKGRTGRWFAELAESRSAAFADIGAYIGGHPMLPFRGRCALYAMQDALLIEVESGQEANVPYEDIQAVDIEVLDGAAFVSLGFRDDRGGSNLVRFNGTWANGVPDWVNFLNSARYEGAIAV